MKKRMMQTVCAAAVFAMVCVCSPAAAGSPTYGLFAGYGQSWDNIDIFRLGLQRQFSCQWFDSRIGFLSGYVEASYNLWKKSSDTVHGAALSPVFVYYFNTGGSLGIIPYVEGGIGVAYIDDYRIAGRNLSSNFQFEDRIGVGALIGRFDIKLGYMHYSNADIKSPNDGIDIWMGTVAWRF